MPGLHAPPAVAPLKQHYDAVIIGSGPGGSAMALRLAQAGRQVLVVERGTELLPRPVADGAPVGRYLRDEVPAGLNAARFLGGQSKFYGAAMYRLRASDFRSVQHEAGVSPAWPFSYESLEPYYTLAEQLYRVHGDPGSDPTEPARSGPLPFGPLPHSAAVAPFVERLRGSGTQVSALPRALDYGPGGKCVLCPTCDGYYCQLDAKWDAENATLRPALRTGNVDVALGSECLKVLVDTQGRQAVGVLLRHGGNEVTVNAGHVVLAAGIPDTLELLWQSRTDRHPDGLGNNTGNLGRHLGGHSTGMVFPLLSWRALAPHHSKTFSINSHYDGAPGWDYPLGMIQVAGQLPYWRETGKLMRLPAWLVAQRSLMLFYMVEAVPSHDSGFAVTAAGIAPKVEPAHSLRTFVRARELAAGIVRAAGYPVIARNKAPFLWHETGTARIGDDPATSVCNADCELHDVHNLYVVDASALPTAGAANTALTIVALSLRAADALLAKH